MFDDEILESFINTFYGYGNYQADYWFIGMEERGGESPDDINKRLDAWNKRGRNEIEDVADYHRAIGIVDHFDERAVLQPTWNKIIRVLLAIEGHNPTTPLVRDYQREQLARLKGRSCLIELLPLPSPGIDKWLWYPTHSRLPFLKSRPEYVCRVKPNRIAHIRERISKYQSKPKVVVFYGFGYEDEWNQIAGTRFSPVKFPEIKKVKNQDTLYIIMKHPVARGITNDYFRETGHFIASNLRPK